MFLLLSVLLNVFPISISDEHSKLDYGSQGHLVGVVDWREGIKLGVWNGSVNKKIDEMEYNENWRKLVEMFNLPADCNAVDIGANDGEKLFEIFGKDCIWP